MAKPDDQIRNKGVILFGVLVSILVFLRALIKIYDYDIWFHLKAGEYIVSTMSIPVTDVFSYTAKGLPWITHEWFFEVVAYLVTVIGGVAGLVIFKALLITLAILFFYRHLVKRGVDYRLAAFFMIVAAFIARERFIERPELFTFLFSVVFFVLLEELRLRIGWISGGSGKRIFIVLPLIMIVWANSHSGAFFAVAITGAFALASLIGLVLKREASDGRFTISLIVLLLLVTAVGLVNPNTYHVYLYPFTALKISVGTGLNLAEYSAPTWEFDRWFFVALFFVWVVFIASIRRLALAHFFIIAFFSILALKYNRNIALWAVLALPVAAVYTGPLLSRLARRLEKTAAREGIATLIALVLIFIVIVPDIAGAYRGGYFGVSIKDGVFPEGAINFLDREKVGGNMYNSYEFGGYIIWRSFPQRKVFVDGRSDIYRELLKEQRSLSRAGFTNIVNRYDINYAIMSYFPANVEYINPRSVFGRELALVWWDDTAMVYLRRNKENEAVIKKYEYKVARPTDLNYRVTDPRRPEVARLLEAELKRNIKENPGGWRNDLLLERLYKIQGRGDAKR